MSQPVKLYGFPLSGHSHRVELFASVAGIQFESVLVDLASGEHKQEAFLSMNPFGQVPVMEDGDVVLSDSNAILVYLARKYAPDWMPSGALEEAEVQRMFSLAAGEIANGPAAARLITVFGAGLDAERAKAVAALGLGRLEKHLDGKTWTVGERPSVADISLYTYIAHAPEGNVGLDEYPNIQGWLSRIEALDGFTPMKATKVGLAA
ncbi:glutathione S-transferase [Sneathiella sp. P13V-1]|uniref:glutathione S-transferase family protein n=1 Tax=Sneathiella sp. P13V-1 TaxID=2697366 RepID=UPI00187B4761|nr:glutathione S-transferase [Sneathiella sp. P13V-1]MBE7638625.1 glutathione S-transferase [Sneathiella sp. P13V-1]